MTMEHPVKVTEDTLAGNAIVKTFLPRSVRRRYRGDLNLFPSSMSPPQNQNHHHRNNQSCDIEALHGLKQTVRMLAEEITGAGDGGYPESCAHEVEKCKFPPVHTEHAGQRSSKNSETDDEAGEEDGGCAVAGKQIFTFLQFRR